MSLGTILLIILILLLIDGLLVFPHSCSWGYGSLGIVDTLLVVLLVLLLLGVIQGPIGNVVVIVRRRDRYRWITPLALLAICGGFPTFTPPLRQDTGGQRR